LATNLEGEKGEIGRNARFRPGEVGRNGRESFRTRLSPTLSPAHTTSMWRIRIRPIPAAPRELKATSHGIAGIAYDPGERAKRDGQRRVSN
jgi:hypothetical protein